MGRLVLRRIFEDLEVVFVGAVVDVHLGFDRSTTLGAILPPSGVLFVEVKATEGVAAVVSVATIAGIREQYVLALVVADPLVAAFGFREIARGAAQAAARLVGPGSEFCRRG